MTISTLPAAFAGYQIDIIIIGNERWVRGGQIGHPLGLTHRRSLDRLLQKHRHEFDTSHTMVVELPTRGGNQLTRLFSEKGVAKLAMHAQTPEGARFREWAARTLTTPKPAPELLLAPALPKELRDELARLWLDKKGARALLRYARLGLGNAEIARLLRCGPNTVRKRRRTAEALGLIEPPANLAQLRARSPLLKLVEAQHGA